MSSVPFQSSLLSLGQMELVYLQSINSIGKSNILDAISFVLGLQSHLLRSQNFKDLIYKGESANGACKFALVSLYYERENGEESIFSRRYFAPYDGLGFYHLEQQNIQSIERH